MGGTVSFSGMSVTSASVVKIIAAMRNVVINNQSIILGLLERFGSAIQAVFVDSMMSSQRANISLNYRYSRLLNQVFPFLQIYLASMYSVARGFI